MSTSSRACTGTTRKGKPCKAHPLKGRDVCLAHADEQTRISANFQQGPRPGRPPKQRLVDAWQARVEQFQDVLMAPFLKALGVQLDEHGRPLIDAEGRPVLTTGAIHVYKGEATDIEDLASQMNAGIALLDRVLGKPKQATEVTGADGGPIEHVTVPVDLDRAGEVASILQEAGVGASQPAVAPNGNGHRTNGNGNGNGSH